MKKTKERQSFHRLMGQIAGYIVYPIVLVALISTLLIFILTPKGKVPSFFGFSVVQIKSGSMVEAGFNVADVVFLNQNINGTLQSGDIIAFYKDFDPADTEIRTALVLLSEWDGVVTNEDLLNGTRIPKTTLEKSGSIVYFHYIEDVYVSPSDGTIFYRTIGSNPNAVADGYIRSDYVVGKYIVTPPFLRSLLSFSTTSLGMILFIVFPLALLVLMECFGLIEQMNIYSFENKVFLRLIPFDSSQIVKYNIGKEMDISRKIYFYATSKEEEKNAVFDFLFSYLNVGTKKEKLLYENALKAKEILQNESSIDYFLFWQSKLTKKSDKNRLKKLQNQFEYETLMKKIN